MSQVITKPSLLIRNIQLEQVDQLILFKFDN